ncbi:MAG: hypothetical protein GY854_01485 [Deltaproteobacteria bacterium]|nr:hypothetical protein [Deltaproteobacteria bacterium]
MPPRVDKCPPYPEQDSEELGDEIITRLKPNSPFARSLPGGADHTAQVPLGHLRPVVPLPRDMLN